MVPVALDAAAAEALFLDLDPFGGVCAAGSAKLVARHIVLAAALGAKLFFDLPLDRQAMAVPAGDVGGVIAQHLVAAHDKVLEDLVHRGAKVDRPVRIGWAVMQDEGLSAPRLGILTHTVIEAHLVPALYPFRLSLWQAAAHGEFGFWQEKRVAIVVRGCLGIVGHGRKVSLELAVVLQAEIARPRHRAKGCLVKDSSARRRAANSNYRSN